MKKKLTEKELNCQQPYFYWLYSIEGIGSSTIARLLAEAMPEELYFMGDDYLEMLHREKKILTKKQQNSWREAKQNWNLYTEYEKLEKKKLSFYPCYHPSYPERLTRIPDPPAGLFVKGRLPREESLSIAVIGARNCSEYGRRMAAEFGSELGRMGVQVISGLARGIDGISQQAAIQAGGSSYAVLGCGADICYPAQNKRIYEGLCTQGGVISSYLPGTGAAPGNFPPRNRIISGLADAVLVVEAREKSGTLITVDMALEQGRQVFALPGRLGDSLSEGCNRLLQQGAGLVLSPQELLWELRGDMEMQCPQAEKEKEGVWESWEPGQRYLYEILDDTPKGIGQIKAEAEQCWGKEIVLSQLSADLMQLCIKGAAKQVGTGQHFVKQEH